MIKQTSVIFLFILLLTLMLTGFSAEDTSDANLLYVQDAYSVTLGGTNGLPVRWSLIKDDNIVNISDFIEGELSETGDHIRFTQKGQYVLSANVTDAAGREFTTSTDVTVYPVPDLSFNIPNAGYVNAPVIITTDFVDVDNPISWSLVFNGDTVILAEYSTGTLYDSGGTITFNQIGNYELTATMTDTTGRAFSNTKSFTIDKELNCDFNIQSTNQHISKSIIVTMGSKVFTDGRTIEWKLTRDGISDTYTGSLNNNGGSINVSSTGTYTLTAIIPGVSGGNTVCSKNFTIFNNAPGIPVIIRNPSSTNIDSTLSITITASATDPDGDTVTLIWENRPAQTHIYPVGSYTIRVKARDQWGAESDWASTTFYSVKLT